MERLESLTGRLAVVTGAGGGLGRVLAIALARADAHVLVVDRDAEGAGSTVAQITAAGGEAEAVTADVTSAQDVDRVFGRAQQLGGVDVLLNDAGGWTPGPRQYPDAAVDEWSRTLDLDLRAPMIWTQRVLQQPAAPGGRVVVNVASSAALGPSPYGSPEYAAAKAGLVRFTASLADAQERHGVRVLCLVPGWIGLERARHEWSLMSKDRRASTPALVPPDLLARVVVEAAQDPTTASGTVVRAPAGDRIDVVPPR